MPEKVDLTVSEAPEENDSAVQEGVRDDLSFVSVWLLKPQQVLDIYTLDVYLLEFPLN